MSSFINEKHIPDALALYEANFWNMSQASFLKEAVEADADWAKIVDELNILLRKQRA